MGNRQSQGLRKCLSIVFANIKQHGSGQCHALRAVSLLLCFQYWRTVCLWLPGSTEHVNTCALPKETSLHQEAGLHRANKSILTTELKEVT